MRMDQWYCIVVISRHFYSLHGHPYDIRPDKYRFFAFCLYSSHIYLCRVVMCKWYLFLLPKPSCSCAFSVLIYIPTYSFIFKNVFYYSCFDSIFK